jgi:hypothetical protein
MMILGGVREGKWTHLLWTHSSVEVKNNPIFETKCAAYVVSGVFEGDLCVQKRPV